MTERFITMTALHFTSGDRLLGKGCAITTGSTMEEALQKGAVQMGTIHYTQESEELKGWFPAKLEQYPEMSLRLTGDRFALVGNRVQKSTSFRRLFGLG